MSSQMRRTLRVDHHLSGAGVALGELMERQGNLTFQEGRDSRSVLFFTQLIFSFKDLLGKNNDIISEGLRKKAEKAKLFSPAKGLRALDLPKGKFQALARLQGKKLQCLQILVLF